jgi:gliding motility-associated-like protein
VGLSNNQIPDPLAFPLQSTTYRVAVRDNKGCPKASFDTVRITVLPAVRAFAGNDTTIVVGQPLQLQASGGDYYEWTPPNGLSDANIPDPVIVLDDDMMYLLKVTTTAGCFAYDTLRIRVFKTEPDIFVPSAFTPNGDRLNDVLTPIPVGVSEIEFFKVYDRWGNLVFSTAQFGKGWDGRIKGKDQPNDTYVWHVRGTAYTGQVIYKKGTVTIIR